MLIIIQVKPLKNKRIHIKKAKLNTKIVNKEYPLKNPNDNDLLKDMPILLIIPPAASPKVRNKLHTASPKVQSNPPEGNVGEQKKRLFKISGKFSKIPPNHPNKLPNPPVVLLEVPVGAEEGGPSEGPGPCELPPGGPCELPPGGPSELPGPCDPEEPLPLELIFFNRDCSLSSCI